MGVGPFECGSRKQSHSGGPPPRTIKMSWSGVANCQPECDQFGSVWDGPGKWKGRNSNGADLREAQRVDLQNRRSEIEALFQIRKTVVHGRQEWRARPGSQFDSAQRHRKGQTR